MIEFYQKSLQFNQISAREECYPVHLSDFTASPRPPLHENFTLLWSTYGLSPEMHGKSRKHQEVQVHFVHHTA